MSRKLRERKFPFNRPSMSIEPFGWLHLVVGIVGTVGVIEYFRTAHINTGIWINYPFYLGALYVLSASYTYRWMYSIFEEVKIELANLAQRLSNKHGAISPETPMSSNRIVSEMEWVIDKSFSVYVIGISVIVGGGFVLLVMSYLDVLSYYPYVGMVFLYGAAHGLFYAPLIAVSWFVYKIPKEYMVGIDIMDPDGVGGYRRVGNATVSLLTVAILLLTIDFLILSSASLTDSIDFQFLALGLYFVTFILLFVIGIVGVFRFRNKLINLRKRKTDLIREEFQELEHRFWKKHDQGTEPHPESETIRTILAMFNRLHSMDLWPINIVSFLKLSLGTLTSLVVVLMDLGYLPTPFV